LVVIEYKLHILRFFAALPRWLRIRPSVGKGKNARALAPTVMPPLAARFAVGRGL
jgi:hypothetical protein